MEVGVDNDGFYSDEEWPKHEPLGQRYLVVFFSGARHSKSGNWRNGSNIILQKWMELFTNGASGSILDGELSKRSCPQDCSTQVVTQVVGGDNQGVG